MKKTEMLACVTFTHNVYVSSTTMNNSIQEILDEVNKWISKNNITVINVETLLIPENKSLLLGPENKMIQCIRVWYRKNTPVKTLLE